MKFTNDSAARSREGVVGPRIVPIDHGDPLELKGTRIVLTRSDQEPHGVVLGSVIDYGATAEARVFVRLDQGSTAFFPLDDIEPEEGGDGDGV